MSFFYPSSTASARSRRTREKDGSGRTSSISSHRRSKDLSKEATKARDERSPPPKTSTPSSLQNSLYAQQNLALDQLPDATTPSTGTPALETSPVLKGGHFTVANGGLYHIHTPAALQPYLESAEEDEDGNDDEDEDDEDDDVDDEDDDEDEDEEEALTSSLHLSSDNERDIKAAPVEKPKETEKLTVKSEDAKWAPFQCPPEDLTPQPKSSMQKVLPFEEEQKMPGQFPLPRSQSPKSSEHFKSQERPKMSSSSISLQDLARPSRDSTLISTGSPSFLSRSTSNLEAQAPPSLHERRSFTPPAPPQTTAQNRASPAFISPLPVRPSFANHHMPHYQPLHPQHVAPSMHQVLEMNQLAPQMAYYMQPHPPQNHMNYSNATHHVPPEPVGWPQLPSPQPPLLQHEARREPMQRSVDEHAKMLGRIQAVLPDFHALLDCYRQVSGGLDLDEKANSKEQHQVEDASADNAKDLQIEKLSGDLERVAKQLVVERNKFRLQIGNLEEEKQSLMEESKEHSQAHRALKQDSESLQEQLIALKFRASQEKKALESKVFSLQEQLNTKAKAELSYATNLAAKDDKHKKQLAAKDDSYQKELAAKEATYRRDLAAKDETHKKTNEGLAAKLAVEQRQNDDSITKLRTEKESAIKSRDAELEKLRRTLSENAEAWRKERETIKNGWEKECREIKTQWEDHCRKLTGQHIKDRDDLQRSWDTSHQKQLKRNDQLQDERDMLRKEVERVKTAWNVDKSKHARASDDFRAMAHRLQAEQVNMQRMMDTWNDVADQRRNSN